MEFEDLLMKTAFVLTAATIVTAVALAATTDKVVFDWKPVKGTKAEYLTTNKHEADMGGGPVDLTIMWDSTVTVDKVEGKRVWLSSEAGEPIAQIDGVDEPGIQVQISSNVQEYSTTGEFLEVDEDDHGFNFGLYSGFILPSKGLDKGESYSRGGVKATYEGTEKYKKWDAHKFSFEFRPKGREAWSSGTIWLSTKDLSLVKRTAILHEVDFGMGPEDVINEIVRTK